MSAAPVIFDAVVGGLIFLAGYLQFTGAEDHASRMAVYAATVRQPWRSFFYPDWLYATRRFARGLRVSGVVGMLIGVTMLVVALLTVFTAPR